MASGEWLFTEEGLTKLQDGTFDLDSDTWKMALFQGTSNIDGTSALYADLTDEVPNSFGYVTGGTSVSLTLSGTTTVMTDSSDAEWTATGGAIVARYAVIYEVGGHVLVYCLLDEDDDGGNDVTANSGTKLIVRINLNGLWRTTVLVDTTPPPPDVGECAAGLGQGVDGDGFTIFTPVTGSVDPLDDTVTIYCSSSTGNDSNDGLTSGTAVQTLWAAYDLLRDEKPDWLLLKKGDTWAGQSLGGPAPNAIDPGDWQKSGLDAENPIVVSTYGTGVRPIIDSENFDGFSSRYGNSTGYAHVAVVGIEFTSSTWDGSNGGPFGAGDTPMGINIVGEADKVISCIHFEDCLFHGYPTGVSNIVFGTESVYCSDYRFHRCIFIDAYGLSTNNNRPNGFYLRSVIRARMTECIFDRNGYHTDAFITSSVFSHNLYMANNTLDISFEECISTRGGSHGLQLRGGGTIRNSFFSMNAISLNLGGGDENFERATLDIVGNVVIEGRDISADVQVTNGTWSHGTLTLTINTPSDAMLKYPPASLGGKTFVVVSGTGATPGNYTIASSGSTAGSIVLTATMGAGGATNVVGYVTDPALYRGWGPSLSHISSGEYAYNIVANETLGRFPVVCVIDAFPASGLSGGYFDMDFHHNIFYRWGEGGQFIYDGGTIFMSGNLMRDNDFSWDPTPEANIVSTFHAEIANATAMHWTNNRFQSLGSDPDWWLIEVTNYSDVTLWEAACGGSGNTTFTPSYSDPDRTPATYMDFVLSTTGSTFEDFFDACRAQGSDSTTGRGTWDPLYTAAAINDYIREGFDMVWP